MMMNSRSFPIQCITTLQYHYHIGAETKWPTFPRRHFQMYFLEWKCLNSAYNFTLICSNGSINNMPALVRIMAWRRSRIYVPPGLNELSYNNLPCIALTSLYHKITPLPQYWSFVRRAYRSPLNSPDKMQVMQSFHICFSIGFNKTHAGVAGGLRHHGVKAMAL